MTTRVTMLYFAAVRELAGVDEEAVELPPDVARVADLAPWLERRHPRLAGRLASVRFARNEQFALATEALEEGDVVAVIPPVAGG